MKNQPTSFGPARRHTGESCAFTRVDLIAVLAGVAVLMAVAWPVLANTRPRSERITCLNNLRQIGFGLRAYASGHGDLWPWLISPLEGGIRNVDTGTLKAQDAYNCFAYASNELVSPKLLVCPSDKETKLIASDFTGVPLQGLRWAGFGNNAVSYFAGLDASEKRPETVLVGDRNIRVGYPKQTCGTVFVTATPLTGFDSSLSWTNSIHLNQGNMGRADGRVQQLISADLRFAARDSEDSTRNNHIILPK